MKPASEHPSGLRVLLVEDEMLVALLLEDMLADLGCTVVGPAANLDRALSLARTSEVDVAILDVNINGGQSYAIADALEARNIPFVFSTGYGNRGLRAPHNGRMILAKPFRQDDLKRALDAAVLAS